MYNNFIRAIHEKRIVEIKVNTKGKGVISRRAIPFDYGPGKIDNYRVDRYHFYNLDSPDGQHNFSPNPQDVLSIELTDETFNPADYVHWNPNWYIEREW